jgi:hypothetical protein
MQLDQLFATNDNGIKNSFRCCSINVSTDNDKSHLNANPLGGLAEVCTYPTLVGGSCNGVRFKKTDVRQFRAAIKSS